MCRGARMDGEISMDGDATEDVEGEVKRFSARSVPTFPTRVRLRPDHD